MTIDARIFNPLYWHILKYLNDSSIRYIYIYGGSSAAKTYSLMQALSLESYSQNYNVLAMRKQSNNIKDTIYKDFKDFNTKLQSFFPDIDIIQNEIRSNNSMIRFKGVDDSEKLKGLAGFTKVFADELTEFSYEDLKQLKKRLRGRKNQQIIGSWNPVSKDHWIKTKVLDKEDWINLPTKIDNIKYSQLSEDAKIQINKTGNTILIRTTYKDNYWVVGHPDSDNIGYYDKHVIADFESDKKHDENNYNVYALGLWGVKSEGLIWKFTPKFDKLKRTENKIYYSHYTEIPPSNYHIIYGLDFGGGGGEQVDECDGKSKTVLKRYHIDKDKRAIYHELLMYKGYVSNEELILFLKENCTDGLIMADNARSDKITELLHQNIQIVGAKSKEGKSGSVNSGIDILKYWNHYIHENSKPENIERENHKWEINPKTGDPTGQAEDKYKDITDTDRYAIIYYHLSYVF